jgi:hypothetical protein
LFHESRNITPFGPDLSKIVKENCNRKLIARYNKLFFYKWYNFDNEQDADELQMGCFKGECLSVHWYYLDTIKLSEDIQLI